MIKRDNIFEEELTPHSQKKGILVTFVIAVVKYPEKHNLISKGVILSHGRGNSRSRC